VFPNQLTFAMVTLLKSVDRFSRCVGWSLPCKLRRHSKMTREGEEAITNALALFEASAGRIKQTHEEST
jgi:hypothetical protein